MQITISTDLGARGIYLYMESRKVQLSGGTTYTVSLPKKWAEEQNIENGTVVHLTPNEDGTLLLTPASRRDRVQWELTVDIGTLRPETVTETVKAIYATGGERVRLRDQSGLSPEIERGVMELNTVLSGFEISETTNTTLDIRNLIDPSQMSIHQNANRMYLITSAMHRDAITAVIDDNPDLAEEVVRRDDEVDKLFAMVARQFRRSLTDLQTVQNLDQTRADLFELYYLVRQFEHIADNAESIATVGLDHAEDIPEQFQGTIEDLSHRTMHVARNSSEVLLRDGTIEDTDRLFDQCAELQADIETFVRRLYEHDETAEAYYVNRLVDRINDTVRLVENIAKMALQRAVRDEASWEHTAATHAV